MPGRPCRARLRKALAPAAALAEEVRLTLRNGGSVCGVITSEAGGTVTLMTPQGYVVEVGEAWPDYPTGDDVADATAMNRALEIWVREHPAQYYWVHRRFKTAVPLQN